VIARSVRVERIWKTALVLTLLLALLCVPAQIGDPASVVFGGAVSIVNLHLIRVLVSRLMSPDVATTRLSSAVTIKLLLLLAVLGVALKLLPIDVASFLVGTTTLFVAIVLDAIWLGEVADQSGNGTA